MIELTVLKLINKATKIHLFIISIYMNCCAILYIYPSLGVHAPFKYAFPALAISSLITGIIGLVLELAINDIAKKDIAKNE